MGYNVKVTLQWAINNENPFLETATKARLLFSYSETEKEQIGIVALRGKYYELDIFNQHKKNVN